MKHTFTVILTNLCVPLTGCLFLAIRFYVFVWVQPFVFLHYILIIFEHSVSFLLLFLLWMFISSSPLHLLPASSISFLSFFFMLIFICPPILWFPFETLFNSQDCVFTLVNNLWILIHPTFKNCVHLLCFVHWNLHMMYLRPSEWMKLSLCLPKPW